MVNVQVVSDYHWILWDAQHGLAWLWSRDVPDVPDPFPTPVEIKPGLTGYTALSMAAVSHDRAIGTLASAGYVDMLEDEDGCPQQPEVPVPDGDVWIFVNDDLMPAEMGGIDEESARLWRSRSRLGRSRSPRPYAMRFHSAETLTTDVESLRLTRFLTRLPS